MFKRTSIFLFGLLIISCSQRENSLRENGKAVQVGMLSIDIPSSASFVKGNGIDSYVAYIVTSANDSFEIEYGPPDIIYDLFDYPPQALPLKEREVILRKLGKLPPSSEAVFSKLFEKDNLQNIYQGEFYMYDTVNGIIAKLVQPKRIGHGKTGLYMPELKDGNSFSIYARNLDSTRHRRALDMFKTIRYK